MTRSMGSRLIRAEIMKLTTTRSPLVLGAAGLLFAALNAVTTVGFAGRDGNPPLGDAATLANVVRGGGIGPWVMMLVAIGLTAGEHQHRTIVTALLATPRRSSLVVAKLLTMMAVGVIYALASMAVGLAAGLPSIVGHGVGVPIGWYLARTALGFVVATMLYGPIGVAVGALTRNVAVAAVGAIVWLLLAEGVLGAVIGRRVVRFFPGQVAAAAAGAGRDHLLPMAAGTVLLVAYTLAATAMAAAVTLRRDVV
jgi:ABC-2 type transport system permease protein